MFLLLNIYKKSILLYLCNSDGTERYILESRQQASVMGACFVFLKYKMYI